MVGDTGPGVGTRAGLRGMVGASIHSGRGGDVAMPCLAAPAKSCSRRAVPATPSWPHWPPALPGGGARGPAAPGRWGHARPGPSSILRLTGSREGVSCHPGAGTEGPWARPRGTAGQGTRRRWQTGVTAPSLHPHTAEPGSDGTQQSSSGRTPGSLRVTRIPPTTPNTGPGPGRGQQTSTSWDATQGHLSSGWDEGPSVPG